MPHQCVRCGEIYPDASKELLEGCKCGGRFFFFINQSQLDKAKEKNQEIAINLSEEDKDNIEKDVREIMNIEDDDEIPIILDLESVRVLGPGKFELDLGNLFSKKRPLIYKLEEGKYIIDLASSFRQELKEVKNEKNNQSGT